MMKRKTSPFLSNAGWVAGQMTHKKEKRQAEQKKERAPDTVTMKMQEVYKERDSQHASTDKEERTKIASAIESVIANVLSTDIALQG